VDAAVRLEINRYNGAVEPRLVLRHAQPACPEPVAVVGEPAFAAALLDELATDPAAWPPGGATGAAAPWSGEVGGLGEGLGAVGGPVGGIGEPGAGSGVPGARRLVDVRGSGLAGLLGDLVAGGGPVLAVAAHAEHRARGLGSRVGGFAVTSWAALEADPGLAADAAHVVLVDPPPHAHLQVIAERLPGEGWTHMAWGGAELEVARRVLAWELDLRAPLAALYRGRPPPRSPARP
jgi:single-stranded-DNA-specific exonuclease